MGSEHIRRLREQPVPGGSRPYVKVRWGGSVPSQVFVICFAFLLAFRPAKVLIACAVVRQTWLSLSLVVPFSGQKGPVIAGELLWSRWGQSSLKLCPILAL